MIQFLFMKQPWDFSAFQRKRLILIVGRFDKVALERDNSREDWFISKRKSTPATSTTARVVTWHSKSYYNYLVMVHRLKILLDVKIHHPYADFVQVTQCFPYGLITIPVWPESVTVVAEIQVVFQYEYR